jgi:hypothetical protein
MNTVRLARGKKKLTKRKSNWFDHRKNENRNEKRKSGKRNENETE